MEIYNEWLEATANLKAAKKEELRLRDLIVGDVLQDKFEGAVTRNDDGFKVVATAKLTRSIDRVVLESIWEGLSDVEKNCIDYKPSLKLADYKKIEASGGALLEAITVKPAQASLKITAIEVE